jgi:hypothetical protein
MPKESNKLTKGMWYAHVQLINKNEGSQGVQELKKSFEQENKLANKLGYTGVVTTTETPSLIKHPKNISLFILWITVWIPNL